LIPFSKVTSSTSAIVTRILQPFAKRWRLAQLAQPGTYELVEVITKRGITRALLFPKAVLRAEFEAEAPLREAMRIKRERLAARRAAKRRPG